MAAKGVLRAQVLARRRTLTAQQREHAGRLLTDALSDLLRTAARVAAYVSVGSEPPTSALLALRPDALLPVLLPGGDLDWASGAVSGADHGLWEPTGCRLGVDAISDCDVVLVPALAVDAVGHRLGRGGGSYDRALRRASGLTIAVLYDDELVSALPTEPHDVAVAAVVTPARGVTRLPE